MAFCFSVFPTTISIYNKTHAKMVSIYLYKNFTEWIRCDVWYRINDHVPSKITVLKPNPQHNGTWRWTFEWWLVHEGRSLANGISDFIKETPETSLSHSFLWGYRERMGSYDLGSRFSPDPKSASAFILDAPASEIVINKCVLFISHPV